MRMPISTYMYAVRNLYRGLFRALRIIYYTIHDIRKVYADSESLDKAQLSRCPIRSPFT